MKKTLSAFKDRAKRTVSSAYLKGALIAVILIPLLYGALYLKAFWDPYANMSELPVAVVNEDSGYKTTDKTENVGNELIKTLRTNDSAKWDFVSAETASKGLNNKKYYAEIIIPSDFSKNVYSVDSSTPTKAQLTYRSREANNFLANTIISHIASEISDRLSHQLISKYFNNIFVSMDETADQLSVAANASSSLAQGLTTIDKGAISLNSGINSALAGSKQLSTGLTTIKNGQDALTTGLNEAATQTQQASKDFKKVSPALSTIVSDLAYYKATGDQTKLAEATAYASALANEKIDLTSSASQLDYLAAQLQKAADSSAQLSSGTSQLLSGSQSLTSGLESLSAGSSSLHSGISSAIDGATQLSDSLSSGATALKEETATNKVTKETAVMSSPVTLKTDDYDIVANYGSGFAPYFISLSLWVGGLMAFFVVDFKKKTVGRRAAMAKYMVLGIIGTVQAVLLASVLQDVLGLSVQNPVPYYCFVVLISWAFMALLQLLIQHLNDIGRYIAVVLLILQLAACAGTFPKETLPSFFQVINPFMPMTYTVQGLRSILYTNDLKETSLPILVLIGILIISTALNLIITKRRKALYYKHEQES